jgi:hypothetical protein
MPYIPDSLEPIMSSAEELRFFSELISTHRFNVATSVDLLVHEESVLAYDHLVETLLCRLHSLDPLFRIDDTRYILWQLTAASQENVAFLPSEKGYIFLQ